MTQISECDVLVKMQVQATIDEIEDLVEVVVARLEGTGLVMVKERDFLSRASPQECQVWVSLSFVIAEWLL